MELNPSMTRTGKNIFDSVSEAVISHQVKSNKKNLSNFFTGAGSKTQANGKSVKKRNTTADMMSLVLFEQVTGNIHIYINKQF